MKTILNACKSANTELKLQVRLLAEPYDLKDYNLEGDESYILVDEADYPEDLFAEMSFGDIHAGGYETAVMDYFYPVMPNLLLADTLPDFWLNEDGFEQWMAGGEEAKKVVPLGYAGNPSEYRKYKKLVPEIFRRMCLYFADKIMREASS